MSNAIPSVGALLAPAAGLLLSALFWGSMGPITWSLTRVYDPVTIAVLRYAVGVPLLLLFAAVLARAAFARPLPWGRVARLGLSMTGFSLLYTAGIMFSHPVTAAIILMCGPVISTLMARRMVGAPIPEGFAPALALAVCGGFAVVLGSPQAAGSGFGLQGGEPLLVAAQTVWAWYSIRGQQWLGDRGQIALSAVSSAAGCAFLIVVWSALAGAGALDVPREAPSWLHVFYLLWVGLAGVALAVLLWNWGVSRLTLPVAALYGNASPVFAVATAALLGENPTWLQVAGGAAVLAGVLSLQVRQLVRVRRQSLAARASTGAETA